MSLSKDKTLRIWPLSEQLQQDLETDLMIDTTYIHIEPPGDSHTLQPQTPPSVKAGIEAESSFGGVLPKKTMQSSSSPSLSSNFLNNSTSTPSPKMGFPGGVSTPGTPSLSSTNSSFFSPSPSDTLAHEFSLLTDIPNLEMERVRVQMF